MAAKLGLLRNLGPFRLQERSGHWRREAQGIEAAAGETALAAAGGQGLAQGCLRQPPWCRSSLRGHQQMCQGCWQLEGNRRR